MTAGNKLNLAFIMLVVKIVVGQKVLLDVTRSGGGMTESMQ